MRNNSLFGLSNKVQLLSTKSRFSIPFDLTMDSIKCAIEYNSAVGTTNKKMFLPFSS